MPSSSGELRASINPAAVHTLRHNSRLHHIGVGRAWAGTRVLMLIHELNVQIITEHGELVRELTLDPTRDYQPQHARV